METKTKLNRIYVKQGFGKELAKVFSCTPETVSHALSGRKDTKLSKKIRHVALTQYGGVEINEQSTVNN